MQTMLCCKKPTQQLQQLSLTRPLSVWCQCEVTCAYFIRNQCVAPYIMQSWQQSGQGNERKGNMESWKYTTDGPYFYLLVLGVFGEGQGRPTGFRRWKASEINWVWVWWNFHTKTWFSVTTIDLLESIQSSVGKQLMLFMLCSESRCPDWWCLHRHILHSTHTSAPLSTNFQWLDLHPALFQLA